MARTAQALIPAMAAPEADPACLAAAVAVMAAIPAPTYRLAVTTLADFDRQADLARIPVPALCVAGAADTVARPAAMAAMARRLPRGQFTEVAGAGHLLPLERPEVFAEILLEFVGGLAEAG
jgi:3-oxoadipate enol-lactonase